MAEQGNCGVVLVTAASLTEAEAIARTLIEAKLAACVSILPQILSVYTWEGQIEQASEVQLLIKTDLNLFSILETTIRQIHSYEVPEIIAMPIVAGSQPYLRWIAEQTTVVSR